MPRGGEPLRVDGVRGVGVGDDRGGGALLQRPAGLGPGQFPFRPLRLLQFLEIAGLQRFDQAIRLGDLVFRLDGADLFGQLHLKIADPADVVVGRRDRRDHEFFGHFAGEALDHQHGIGRAGDDQIEIAVLQGVVRGEGDELAVDVAQPHRGDRPVKGERRENQRRRTAIHRQHVAVVLAVGGEDEAHHLDLVVKPVGKSGANRAVHQPRGEDFLGGRAAFALEEPAGELARRRHPLAIIAGQGKEILPRASGARRGGAEHDRLAVLHQTTSGGLSRQFAGFNRECSFANLAFNTCFHCCDPAFLQ